MPSEFKIPRLADNCPVCDCALNGFEPDNVVSCSQPGCGQRVCINCAQDRREEIACPLSLAADNCPLRAPDPPTFLFTS